MESSGSIPQEEKRLSYPAPKRIKVVTMENNDIQVTLETDRPDEEYLYEEQQEKAIPETSPPDSKDVAIQDTQKDGYFETELENKTATFVISDAEWETIKPRNMPSGGRLLTGPWSHVLSEHLRKSNPHCCFAFHYNRLKTENSRKRLAPFFKGIGICKIKECGVTVRLLIRGINEKQRIVDVSYTGRIRHKLSYLPWRGVVRAGEPRGGMMLLGMARDLKTNKTGAAKQKNHKAKKELC